jgi:transposase
MNRHLFVSLHSLFELDLLPRKRQSLKGVLSQKTEDAFGITYKTVVVCVLITREDGTVEKHIRTFSTMTTDLLALDEWLRGLQVEHVVMESTGVFWHPIYNLLEEGRTILLVNPQHMRAVPGHKTDVKDAEWLADLHRHGLLKASFIPPAPIRELRELTRYRKTLVQERAQEINRLQKVLEGANIKLAAVATDVLGRYSPTRWWIIRTSLLPA